MHGPLLLHRKHPVGEIDPDARLDYQHLSRRSAASFSPATGSGRW